MDRPQQPKQAAEPLKPCPFCGHQPDLDDEDVLYPINRERKLWNLTCPVPAGGCDAAVLGSSPQECIKAWNRRVGEVAPTAKKHSARRKPTGFVATCQCGMAIGAMDRQRTPAHEASQILGRWLAEGFTITPQFEPNWKVSLASCCCETHAQAHDAGGAR